MTGRLFIWLLVLATLLAHLGSAAGADPAAWPAPRPMPTKPGERPAPTVELYTMGRGERLVEKFGHAALCLRYPGRPEKDTCYNYGTTDFEQPISLGWGFLRGRANFWVSTTTLEGMLNRYRSLDRSIYRQVLPLTPEQALRVEAKLEHDQLPENRHYTYHHFYDNCTTRVRDIIDGATGGALSKGSNELVGPTFRDYGRAGFAEQTWLLLVSDFILGRRGDVKPTLREAMFLPRILRAEVSTRLGVKPEGVYARQGRSFSSDPSSGRIWLVLFAVLTAAPLIASTVTGRRRRLGMVLTMIPLSLLGLTIWALAASSTLPELRYNEALLVFVPWDIAVLFLRPVARLRYARARVGGLVAVLGLLALGVFTQPLWIPLLIALVPHATVAFWPQPERALSASPSAETSDVAAA